MKKRMPKNQGRFKKAVSVSLVASLLLQPLGAAEVIVVKHFPANRGPGYRKPCPDAAGAVGPRHTAVLDDRAFVVQDKATGKVLRNDTQHEFWLKVLPAGTFDLHANDPRLLYDPLTQRWIAWVQGLNPQNGYLAVSTSSDPTGSWRGVKMPIPRTTSLQNSRFCLQTRTPCKLGQPLSLICGGLIVGAPRHRLYALARKISLSVGAGSAW